MLCFSLSLGTPDFDVLRSVRLKKTCVHYAADPVIRSVCARTAFVVGAAELRRGALAGRWKARLSCRGVVLSLGRQEEKAPGLVSFTNGYSLGTGTKRKQDCELEKNQFE